MSQPDKNSFLSLPCNIGYSGKNISFKIVPDNLRLGCAVKGIKETVTKTQ